MRDEDKSLVEDEDLQPKTPQSAESTPRRLQRQIDIAIGDHRTSASMINAVAGQGGISTRGEVNCLILILAHLSTKCSE